MSSHNITYHFQYKKRKSSLIILNVQLWDSFQGTQEQVRNSRGKRAFSVGATEVRLYFGIWRLYRKSSNFDTRYPDFQKHLSYFRVCWELLLLTLFNLTFS